MWQKLKLWQSKTTLLFTKLLNFNWNKTEEKTDFRNKISKYYNTKKKLSVKKMTKKQTVLKKFKPSCDKT